LKIQKTRNDIFDNSSKIIKKFSLNIELIELDTLTTFLSNIHTNFITRFNDLKTHYISFTLFSNPFKLQFNEIPLKFQAEFKNLDIYKCEFLSLKTNNDKINFFKNLPWEFIKFKNNCLKIDSYFGGSYICEILFSCLKFRKDKYSTRINQDTLFNVLRVACSNDLVPNFEKIIKN